jgi:hypothetical protein
MEPAKALPGIEGARVPIIVASDKAFLNEIELGTRASYF